MSVLSGEKFELKLIPAEQVLLHEQCEDDRFNKLIERFNSEKVLYNPLIIGKFKKKYILIDGANRFEALKRIGCKTILAQLVDYASRTVKLKSWYHFVKGLSMEELISFLENNNLNYGKCRFSRLKKKLNSKFNYIGAADKNGNAVFIKLSKKMPEMLNELCSLNKYYESKFSYVRIDSDTRLDGINHLSAEPGILFIYPAFNKKHIIKIAGLREKLPAGITRHLIPNRVLHIKFEIESMKSGENIEQSNCELQKLIENKIEFKKVRLYREPVLIFDE